MTSRSESARNVIRVNATSIDVTSSDTITFGYVNELARAGRIIAGRHRLHSPMPPDPAVKHLGNAGSSLWRADSLYFGDAVLVELLDPAIAEDASLADVFESEVRAAAAVSNPFVSRVLDFGIECSTPYVVSELGVGETLAARVAARRKPSSTEFKRVFAEIAAAVDAMHAVGVLHRDLRTERVQLCGAGAGRPTEHEAVKVSFGISKLMNDTLDLVRTMARRVVAPAAAPLYASPEQVLGTSPLGPQSDLWSLAVVAFEWVTGELPFVGATTGEQLVQICAGPARVPSEVTDVPIGFDEWFARGVAKCPTERWASGREMTQALSALSCCRARKSTS